MSVVLAIFNQKGGAGKTTLSMCLAGYLKEQGREVIVVDADPQRSAHKWETKCHDNVPHFPVPVEALSGLTPGQFGVALEGRMKPDTDFVIIDTPPRLDSAELFASLLIADLALLPFVPDALHVDALEEVKSVLEEVNERRRKNDRPALDVRLVVNKFDSRRANERELAENIGRIAGLPVFRTKICARSDFSNAGNYRTTLSVAARRRGGKAEAEIAALMQEIEEVFTHAVA
jgi:chromosome partitioning protein